MICTICGFDNPADGRFCKKCGAALVVPAGTNAMPAAAAVGAQGAAVMDAPAPAGGIPKPYIIIVVVALVILVAAWYAWRQIGVPITTAPEATAPATTAEPSANPATATAPAAGSSEPAPTPAAGAATEAPAAANAPDAGAAGASSTVISAPEAEPAKKGPAHKAPAKAATKAPAHPAPAPVTTPPPPPAPAPAPAAKAPTRPDRWTQMDTELRACANANFLEKVVCEQRIRNRYCDGFWGKVPQCPAGPAPTTGG